MKTLKKVFIILFAFIIIFTFVSCSDSNDPENQETYKGEKMSLISSNCNIYTQGTEPSEKISIYNAKNYGDIPYVDVSEMKKIFSALPAIAITSKFKDGAVTLTKDGQDDCYVTFDANKNELSFKNITRFPVDATNEKRNPLGYDYCLTVGHVIRSSSSTKIGTENKDEGKISLNQYDIKMITENSKVFVPLEFALTVLQPNFLEPIVYNGKDIFLNPISYKNPTFTSLCYSSKGDFIYGYTSNNDKCTISFKKVNTQDTNQAYLFYSTNMYNDADGNIQLVLYKDGTGKMLAKENDKLVNYTDGIGNIFSISYTETKDELTIYTKITPENMSEGVKAGPDFYDHLLKVNLKETRYGKLERSSYVANYTYSLLCFSYDNLYAIKDDKNIKSFDLYFAEQGLKEKLKSTDISIYSEAMFELLHVKIDDGHTIMQSLPMYGYQSSAKLLELQEKYKSTHTQTILNKGNEYSSHRFTSFNFNSSGLRIEENEDTAYLSFDSFIAGADGTPNNFNLYNNDYSSPFELINIDTSGYLASSLFFIERYNANPENKVKVKNIVIDISTNGGGAMSMLPYVACIMTKDPMLCMGDSRSGQIIEYHYEADFNGDGTYGDTYADKYNFFLLTSDASFSCGSSLPAMLKGTNVKIIGKAGAGGACPVTTFTDGSGIVYQTSGYMGVYYKDGDKYISIENGVPVDYELEESEWYDYENLTKKIDSWVQK